MFRDAGHLPNRRPDRQPPDPAGLPRQRRGVTPQRHGRYPDYDVLADRGHWDEVTRAVVLARVEDVPPRRFFTRAEFACLCAFCDVVLAQDAEPRIPVMSFVDAKLHAGQLDGFQHVGMPDDRDTWRLVARGLDEAAGGAFAGADDAARLEIVGAFARGELHGGVWDGLPHAWTVVMRAVLSAFYAHPWAWNEIGFGGAAYPRGYMRLAADEPHEGREAFGLDPVEDVQRRGMP
ncbi:MAG TPA: gluconate 2-dehydrogenase subunit 3 family protein [Solirubrobacter sp.]|nr:gluconate 2-dehydrogenase subunit 3 family protein [Solirubrobacter sp.]